MNVSQIYLDLAKKIYNEEQFKTGVAKMLPIVVNQAMPDELIDMLISGMQDEYQNALAIYIECLQSTYTESQAEILLSFYNENDWMLTKSSEFTILTMTRMTNEFAPSLTERIFDEYERIMEKEV